jgi:Rnl2 family RNA ligase
MEEQQIVQSSDKKLTFRKYASIENSYLDKFIESIINQGHTDNNAQWVALEKIHGANFSFITNGEEINCAKRTGFVEADEVFHNHHLVLENHREKILKVYAALKEKYPELYEVAIYGELFGGIYPHKDVPGGQGLKSESGRCLHVQRDIYYSPDIRFYAFDIAIPGKGYLQYDIVEPLFKEHGFLYAEPIKYGTLKELLEIDVESFVTALPAKFGLPALPNNFAEGIVIKPIVNKYMTTGERVIVKKKRSTFMEKRPRLAPKKEIKTTMADNVREMCEEVVTYVTLMRLKSVISKEGQITNAKIGKLLGLFAKVSASRCLCVLSLRININCV